MRHLAIEGWRMHGPLWGQSSSKDAASSRRWRAADGEQMVDRARAMAHTELQAGLQGLPHESFGAGYRLRQGHALGQKGGDGGGQGAAGAVGVRGGDARA